MHRLKRLPFGDRLLELLNWPEPPDDLGEFRKVHGWDDALLQDARLAVRFLRRFAEAHRAGKLELSRSGREAFLPATSLEHLDECAALRRFYDEQRHRSVLRMELTAVEQRGSTHSGIALSRGFLREGTDMHISEILVIAADELLELVTDPRFHLDRCQGRRPKRDTPCSRWFINYPGGRKRQYCSSACQRSASRRTAKLRNQRKVLDAVAQAKLSPSERRRWREYSTKLDRDLLLSRAELVHVRHWPAS